MLRSFISVDSFRELADLPVELRVLNYDRFIPPLHKAHLLLVLNESKSDTQLGL